MQNRPTILLPLLTFALAACAHDPATTQTGDDGDLFLRGTARVISVNPALGRTVLEFEGRQINAYWETQTTLAQGGSIVQDNPLKPPVGNYTEGAVRQQEFAAVPGDTIAFVGMKTGHELFLRGIQVIAH